MKGDVWLYQNSKGEHVRPDQAFVELTVAEEDNIRLAFGEISFGSKILTASADHLTLDHVQILVHQGQAILHQAELATQVDPEACAEGIVRAADEGDEAAQSVVEVGREAVGSEREGEA